MFTSLVAGLCALMIEHHGTEVVGIGRIRGPTCDVVLMLPDGATTPPNVDPRLGPFRFGVRIGTYAAIVNVDQREFRVPRGAPI
jgi:hypothetical protein